MNWHRLSMAVVFTGMVVALTVATLVGGGFALALLIENLLGSPL